MVATKGIYLWLDYVAYIKQNQEQAETGRSGDGTVYNI